jgi:hypothetical protein
MAERQRKATGSTSPAPFDTTKFVNPAQVGGVEAYEFTDGEGRGTRALWFNTGGGLRFRVLPDRGLDIDQAFVNQYSLAFLTHKGVTPPRRAHDKGIEWLKGFPGGLLTSCGPFNIGPPGEDPATGEQLGLHGDHSNTAATLESVVQPDPRAGRVAISVTGVVRYGRLFGPLLELRRTITCALGVNAIDISDDFFNPGNVDAPHAWLLHINFGYPLVDEGSELCYDSPKVEPKDAPEDISRFRKGIDAKRIPGPLDAHHGSNESVAYLFPRADRNGHATVGIVNRKLSLGVAIHYSTKEFGRCVNWQHWGRGEYVTALEPANGTVEGRWKDRERGLLDTIPAGGRKTYRYRIEVVTSREGIEALRALNGTR